MATRSRGHAGPVREVRSIQITELRTEKNKDGKQFLTGYAATYNTVSSDLGFGMRERIMPGAFKRALQEKQDVRHLINHDANLVLGRTESGTTELAEDDKGLKFKTLLPDTSYARDLAELVDRGDVNECSFGFTVNGPQGQRWIAEKDPNDPTYTRDMRELLDVDLFDISTVTYPAYSNTKTQLSARSMAAMFPEGMPAELRSRVSRAKRKDEEDDCGCNCDECEDDNCADCSNNGCDDANCGCAHYKANEEKAAKEKADDEEAKKRAAEEAKSKAAKKKDEEDEEEAARKRTLRARAEAEPCACSCDECQDGDCEDCTNEECDDMNCRCGRCNRSLRSMTVVTDGQEFHAKCSCGWRSRAGTLQATTTLFEAHTCRAEEEKTKRIDGEDLKADAFLIVGDKDDTKTWKLPWKFASEEKTKRHLRNALARFNQLKGVSEAEKKAAWTKLVSLCKKHDIDVSGEESSSIRSHLTVDQLFDLEVDPDAELRRRRLRLREIQMAIT
jgi:hypothetical protein